MKIETPLNVGDKVYYWSFYATLAEFKWHLVSGNIRYVKTETDCNGDTTIWYFVDGTYRWYYEVFATEQDAIEEQPITNKVSKKGK